jgi:hypothetical protein
MLSFGDEAFLKESTDSRWMMGKLVRSTTTEENIQTADPSYYSGLWTK